MKDRVSARQQKYFRMRLAAFLILHGLIALHLYTWYGLGIHWLGAIDMQELFRNLIEKNVLTVGALFFLIFIGVGLLWGRIFCGWFCHIGQVYDLLGVLYRRWGLKLGWFPTRFGTVFAAFVLIWYFLREALRNRSDSPLVVAWAATAPWELLPGWVNGTILLLIVFLVLPQLLGPRAFCRNICPWGVLLGLSNRFARTKVRRVGDCTNCGACSPACPMDIDVSRVINTDFSIKSSACTNCLQCVAVCPTNALSFTVAAKENRAPRAIPLLPAMQHVPLVTELMFWLLALIVGLVYDEIYGIGIFLAYSLGLILAWSSLQLRRWWRKHRGLAAAACLVLSLLWLNVAKDGLAAYHWSRGHAAWERQDVALVQAHYEKADALFWYTPTVLMYRLYMIYKGTGQENKRKALYDRYEARRATQGKTHAPQAP